jgi:hypothetical protein
LRELLADYRRPKMEIKKITEKEARDILLTEGDYEPRGLFYLEDYNSLGRKVYVGIDNSTGDAWVEDFNDLDKCKMWLQGHDVKPVI